MMLGAKRLYEYEAWSIAMYISPPRNTLSVNRQHNEGFLMHKTCKVHTILERINNVLEPDSRMVGGASYILL